VIPQITGVAVPAVGGAAKEVQKPTTCPCCDAPVVKELNQVAIRCSGGLSCPAQIIAKIQHYVSRDGMNIVGFGDRLVEGLHENGRLNTLADIYRLRVLDIASVEGQSFKTGHKILKAIEASKTTTFAKFLFSLGIPLVGESTAKALAKRFRTWGAFTLEASYENLTQLPDIGDSVANSIFEFLRDNAPAAAVILDYGVGWPVETETQSPQPLKGQTWVITGTLSRPRDHFKEVLERVGAKVSGSVSKKTSYVLAGEAAGNKLDTAKSLGVVILTESEFEGMRYGQ
jgi:DNA ligase (NAD+)